jgi:pentatricopeptide repeat protein
MIRNGIRKTKSFVVFDFLAPSFFRHQSSHPNYVNVSKPPPSKPPPPSAFPVDSTNILNLHRQIRAGLRASPTLNDELCDSPFDETFKESVDGIREALKSKNFSAVCDHWTRLQKENLSCFLRAPDFVNFVPALVEIWNEKDLWIGSSGRWANEQAQRVFEDISLQAAARNVTDALGTVFDLQLRWGNPRPVLELHEKYLELSKEFDDGDEAEDVSIESDLLAWTDYRPKGKKNKGSVHLLLGAITAHAMQDSFDDAIKMVIKQPIRWRHSITNDMTLSGFGLDSEMRTKAEEYARRLDIAGVASQPARFGKRIQSLVKMSDTRLHRFYQSVIDEMSGPDAFMAASPSSTGFQKPVIMPQRGWTWFITGFFECNRADLAEKLRTDMQRLDAPLGLPVWIAFINGYNSIKQVDNVLAAWDSMLQHGIQPDTLAYHSLILALFDAEKTAEAMRRFKLYRETSEIVKSDPAHVLLLYNVVVTNLLRKGHLEMAFSVLKTMDSYKVKPDIVTFNSFLRHFGEREDLKAMATTLRQIKKAKLDGDVVTWSTVLFTLLKAGVEDASKLVLDLMRANGVEANVVTYSGMIHHLVKDGTDPQLETAFQLLKRMETEYSTRPTLVTYTSILAAIYRGQWADKEAANQCRHYVLEKMESHHIKVDKAAYNFLIRSCLENREQEGLTNALKLYREMTKENLVINPKTWHVLLTSLIARNDWDVALECVVDLEKQGLHPGTPLWRLVNKIKSKARIEFVE